ncbi:MULTISPECIES: AMP-binding protein [Marinobacter]|uniref:ATP-dependent acyl-CoA ligase n=1 Tax=Marinobacter salsuginis TaxID=418719 RepID=A0A5M3PQ52_9GAMM|nr:MULTISPECIES: AMP-binding protein [Marinobacter]GBO84869.1 ATP-dependent acyl-CoA ligase [Marinobacter salsuginis]
MLLNDQLSEFAIPDSLSEWTLPKVAARRVGASPEAVFARDVSGNKETYGQFMDHAEALAAHFLQVGIEPGDRILVFADNSIAALHAWMAAALVGAVDVSANTGYRGNSLAHVLNLAKPSLIVSDAHLIPFITELNFDFSSVQQVVVIDNSEADPTELAKGFEAKGNIDVRHHRNLIATPRPQEQTWPEILPSDAASVVFTSGTTGPAKGVVMPHGHVCLLAHTTAGETGMNSSDVFYSAHPLFHIAGKFMGVLAIFAAGGTLVLDRKFDAKSWLDRIRESGATISIAHGPMIEMIQAEPARREDSDNALTRLMCCPLPKRHGYAFLERFGVKGIEMWGMSEIGCPCWTSRQSPAITGSCGKVLTEWYDVELVDSETDRPIPDGTAGEIVVRPRFPWTTMLGYMGMPEETVSAWRNLWFHTGDIAVRDSSGNLFYVDRKGDRIRRRAENISSFDIEAAVADFPGVKECVAIGVPSGYENDDDILVYIVAMEEAVIEPQALLSFLAQTLPHFMVPRYIELTDELPRTPTNKVKKKQLSERGIQSSTWDRKAAGISLKKLIDPG